MTPPLQKGCSHWGRTTDRLVLRTPSPHGIRPAPRTRRSPLCNRAPADHTRASLGQHVPWPVSPRTVKGPLVSSSRGDWPGLFRGRRRRWPVRAATPQVSDPFSPFGVRYRVNTVAGGGPGPGEAGAGAGCRGAQRRTVRGLAGGVLPDAPPARLVDGPAAGTAAALCP